MYNWFGYSNLKKENERLKQQIEEQRLTIVAYQKMTEGASGTINDLNKDLKFLKAKLQIVQNDYQKCSRDRDEYKHQLNAANKDIKINQLKAHKYKECNHCGYKIAYNMNQSGCCDCCSDGMMIEKQEYCGYPLHWGGYSK